MTCRASPLPFGNWPGRGAPGSSSFSSSSLFFLLPSLLLQDLDVERRSSAAQPRVLFSLSLFLPGSVSPLSPCFLLFCGARARVFLRLRVRVRTGLCAVALVVPLRLRLRAFACSGGRACGGGVLGRACKQANHLESSLTIGSMLAGENPENQHDTYAFFTLTLLFAQRCTPE